MECFVHVCICYYYLSICLHSVSVSFSMCVCHSMCGGHVFYLCTSLQFFFLSVSGLFFGSSLIFNPYKQSIKVYNNNNNNHQQHTSVYNIYVYISVSHCDAMCTIDWEMLTMVVCCYYACAWNAGVGIFPFKRFFSAFNHMGH